jgi:ATP-binding cassette subfamily B protein
MIKSDSEIPTWPLERVGDAVYALGYESGLARRNQVTPSDIPGRSCGSRFPGNDSTRAAAVRIERWVEAAASSLGLEVVPVSAPYSDLEKLIRCSAPALLGIGDDATALRFIALVGGSRRSVRILGPDFREHRLPMMTVRNALCAHLESPLRDEIDALIATIGISTRRSASTRAAILKERIGTAPIGQCWLLRLSPGRSFFLHLRRAGALGHFIALTAGHLLRVALVLLSWWLIGRVALGGQFEQGWVVGWGLLLLTLVRVRHLLLWVQGMLAISSGSLLKQQLLCGVLNLEPEQIRHLGAGQLLGRILECETLESLALNGGVQALFSCVDIVGAAVVLGFGAGGPIHSFALVAWTAVAVFAGWKYIRSCRDWSEKRFALTQHVVEQMIGYRTRLSQEALESWHLIEDQALEDYLKFSTRMDRMAAFLTAAVPRGWMLVGFLGIAPALFSAASSVSELAISLGGVLYSFRALELFVSGLTDVGQAGAAWTEVETLLHAASRSPAEGCAQVAVIDSNGQLENGDLLIEARNLTFRHQGRAEPILRGCNVRVCKGDHVLIEGPSGSGKSTLGSLLAALRLPESGLILLNGLDPQTLGHERWRERIVMAPQFHENHVLTETLAFNLLMGRGWPPSRKDVEEAELVCRELGLGELFDRMPAGMLQMVGESGWQLSHGEKSRLYIARALLQGTEMVILDESFAALDSENRKRTLLCALKRSPTLLVITHQ